MPVSPSDIKLFKSTNTPTDDTSPVGGAISATQILGATIGEVFRTITANPAGSSSQVRYQKVFYKNTNASLPLNAATIFLANSLDDTPGNGTCTVQSDNSADGSALQAQVIGIDNTGTPNQEILILNGTNLVTGVVVWSQVWKVIIQANGTSTPTATTGNITVSVGGIVLGAVPAGFYSATAEIKISAASALNDASSSVNDLTAPAGFVFTKPRTYNTGLNVANSGSLTAGAGQGTWVQQTIPAGLATSTDVQIAHGWGGTA
jgi:hypothetical protein